MPLAARSNDQPLEQPVKTVLVADDSRLQRRILVNYLEKWGFLAVEAASGQEGLEVCRSTPVDMVISDWVMPGMDGLEFCRAFRDMQAKSYGYFILVTSKDDKRDIALGLDAGADDILTKPVNSGELQARMRAGVRVLRMQAELVERNRCAINALSQLQSHYREVEKDLQEARKLQQSLVPKRRMDFRGARLEFALHPSGPVGGDMVGLYHSGDSRLGVYALDVAGHGVSAAMLTARIAGYLEPSNPADNIAMSRADDGSYQPRPVDEVAALLNHRLNLELDTDLYLTLLLADIDLETGDVSLVQAGHPPPLLIGSSGVRKFLGNGGTPVGLLPTLSCDTIRINVSPGDRILIYSDGFPEARRPDGRLLGEAGFSELVAAGDPSEGEAFLYGLVEATMELSGEGDTDDDLSAILFSFNGAVSHADDARENTGRLHSPEGQSLLWQASNGQSDPAR